MMEDIREFAPRSLRGPKGEFQIALKRFCENARRYIEEFPEAHKKNTFTRFAATNYASKNSAAASARTAMKMAIEWGDILDYRTAQDPVDERWYIWFRLEPKADS